MEIETTENNINELISRIDARYGKNEQRAETSG